MALNCEQAQEQLAFGRQAGAVAVAAKRLRDARNHADFATAVAVTPARSGFAGQVCADRVERELGVDARDDLARRQHFIHPPAVGRADVHVLDEAQHHRRAFEVACHGDDLRIVRAALDDHVDFDRPQANTQRGVDAGEHVGDRKVGVVHAPKNRVVECVEADGDALQAGILQGLGLARQHRAVGRQGQVEHVAIRGAQRRQHRDQHFEVFAQQGLAASQANLAHTVGHKQPRAAQDFFKTQQRRVRQKFVVLVEDLARHAVAAPKIAAIGHGNSQVAQRSAERVGQQAGDRRVDAGHTRHDGCIAVVRHRNNFFYHCPIVTALPGPPLAIRRLAEGPSADQ